MQPNQPYPQHPAYHPQPHTPQLASPPPPSSSQQPMYNQNPSPISPGQPQYSTPQPFQQQPYGQSLLPTQMHQTSMPPQHQQQPPQPFPQMGMQHSYNQNLPPQYGANPQQLMPSPYMEESQFPKPFPKPAYSQPAMPSQQIYPQQPAASMPQQPSYGQPNPQIPYQQPQMAVQQHAPVPAPIPSYIHQVHPKYLSLSCSTLPDSNALRLRSHLSFGAVLRPLADPPRGAVSPNIPDQVDQLQNGDQSQAATRFENGVPVVNFGASGVIRCVDCRTYINPFVQWLDNGARWNCNICGLHNEVPPSYFSPLDQYGRRLDVLAHPELIHANCEFVAPVDYMVRPPMPPVYWFVIDVSLQSVQSGLLNIICETILKSLDELPGDKRTMIGFITFDSSVHFYSMKGGLDKPQMIVLPDVDEIFLPAPENLLVNLDDSRAQVESLLSSLPTMHAHTTNVESALGPALDASLEVIGRIGGLMLIFLSNLPSIGAGRLVNRENTRLLGTDKEHTLLSGSDDTYKKRAITFTKFQITCDLFAFTNAHDQYMDLGTLSDLTKFTGGTLYYYEGGFNAVVNPVLRNPNTSVNLTADSAKQLHTQHALKLQNELKRSLTRNQGWEAVLRVRSGKSVVLNDFHGNFYLRGTDLLALPHIDSDKAFTFAVSLNETEEGIASIRASRDRTILIQSALLYTTSGGERRIRVQTVVLPFVPAVPANVNPTTGINYQLRELYSHVNTNAIINLVAKKAVSMVINEGFDKAREEIRNRCVALLRTFNSTEGQTNNPNLNGNANNAIELAQVLPLMTLGLLKNLAFKEGADVRSDVRCFALSSMYTMDIIQLETFIRPRMLPLHDLLVNPLLGTKNPYPANDPANDIDIDNSLVVDLPNEASLTAAVLKPDTMYLIDNGVEFVLRVGKHCSPELLLSLFSNLQSVDQFYQTNSRLLANELHLAMEQLDDSLCNSSTPPPLARFKNILTYLRAVSSRTTWQALSIVKEGEPSEIRFLNLLIEDRNMSAMSLTEFDSFIYQHRGTPNMPPTMRPF